MNSNPRIAATVISLAFLALVAGVSAQSPAAYTVYIYVYGTPCVGETLTLQSYIYPTPEERQYQWFIEGADGTKATGIEEKFALRLGTAGTYSVSLIVSDRQGTKLGSNQTTVQASQCGTQPAATSTPTTTEPHRDCYDERTGTMYACDSPPPTSTYGCVTYRDANGHEYYQCDGTQPQPTTTYDADACQRLSDEQAAFFRQWKYEYYAYYEKSGTAPGSDPEFEQQMRDREATFNADWQSRWTAHGCDRPYGYTDPNCGWYWDQAQFDISALKTDHEALWQSHYDEMNRVRSSWASYSEEERTALESKWRQYAADLSAKYDVAMRSIADRYRLWECGYHGESVEPVRVAVYDVSGERAAETGFVALRSDCDARLAAVKELYIDEFASIRLKLEQTDPSSPDYAALRERLAALEAKVSAEMAAIIAECRNEYKDQYSAPGNFRDGMGSLQCYYDDASGKIQCRGAYVSFVGDPQTQFLSRFTCGGQPVFDDLYANRVFEDFEFVEDQDAASLLIRSENLKLIFHDGPRGVINVGAVGDAELYLVPSAYLAVEKVANGLNLNGQAGWTSALIAQGGEVSYDEIKHVITIRGEATWVAESCRPDGSDPDGDLGGQYYEAIRARRLGAQVTISLDNDDEEDYSDMDIDIERDGRKYLATIDSAEGTCKTVVLRFDQGIFDTIRLNVIMMDETGDPIPVKEAENLEDVLDPCNDGEQGFEYWIVQDRLGTQVIVSFAHFSEKRVSVEAASVGNVVVPGFQGAFTAVAIGLALVAVVAVRRRLTP